MTRILGTKPFDEFEAFSDQAKPVPWGPDGAWQATFGGRVVLESLVSGLRGHPEVVAKRYPGKAEPYAVVLGCVPWLTSPAVVNALIDVGTCCVVVDKAHWNP